MSDIKDRSADDPFLRSKLTKTTTLLARDADDPPEPGTLQVYTAHVHLLDKELQATTSRVERSCGEVRTGDMVLVLATVGSESLVLTTKGELGWMVWTFLRDT